VKKNGQTRSNASVNHEVALLRHLLNSAMFYEMLEVNLFDKFQREQNRAKKRVFLEEPKRGRVLKPEELNNVLPYCRPYLRNIILGLLCTGPRVRDLLRLKWADIDWQE
jgi:integrase